MERHIAFHQCTRTTFPWHGAAMPGPNHGMSAFNPRLPFPGGERALSDIILSYSVSFITTKACAGTAGRNAGAGEG